MRYGLRHPQHSYGNGWYVVTLEDSIMYLRPSLEVKLGTGWSEKKNVGFWKTREEAMRARDKYLMQKEDSKKHDDEVDAISYLFMNLEKEITDSLENQRGDGKTASYYLLPENATELKHLIRHKKMNHAIGEAFCAIYRLNDNGEKKRNIKKAIAYLQDELESMK